MTDAPQYKVTTEPGFIIVEGPPMKRGRKPKAAVEAAITNTPAPLDVTVPEPPGRLLDDERAEFIRVAALLAEAGTLALVDVDIIADYAEATVMMNEAKAYIDLHGTTFKTINGYPQQRPEYQVYLASQKIKQQLQDKLGMSPSSREKIKVKPKEAVDELAAFINTRKNKDVG